MERDQVMILSIHQSVNMLEQLLLKQKLEIAELQAALDAAESQIRNLKKQDGPA